MSGFTPRLEIQILLQKLLFLLFVSFLKIGLLKNKHKNTGRWKHGLPGVNGGKEKSIHLSHGNSPTRSPGD